MFTWARNCLTARARKRDELRAKVRQVSEAHLDNLLIDLRIARAKVEQRVEQNEPAPEAEGRCAVSAVRAQEAVPC
jgi:hypothetical protein